MVKVMKRNGYAVYRQPVLISLSFIPLLEPAVIDQADPRTSRQSGTIGHACRRCGWASLIGVLL